MKSVALKAFPRTLTRRGGVKKLRAQGRIPAVIYGAQRAPESLELDQKEFENLTSHSVSENLLVDLSIGQDSQPARLVLLQEIQHNPLSRKVIHVDLHEVDPNVPVTIQVPLETEGEAVGVKQGGGILEHVVFKVRVRALPRNLPEFISVDVTNLEAGKSLHLGDIKAPEGVELLGDPTIPVIAVAQPRTEVETAETPAAAGATASVEMIKEKKDQPAAAAAGKKPAEAGKKPADGAKKAEGGKK
jgi:large subunit ribosomal protein L25